MNLQITQLSPNPWIQISPAGAVKDPSALLLHCDTLMPWRIGNVAPGLRMFFVFTLHLNGKNLLNNSSWDFEHIFDTRNSYGLCPGQNCFSKSLVFFVDPGLVKWRPLKQTKTQNGHHFFSSTFHN